VEVELEIDSRTMYEYLLFEDRRRRLRAVLVPSGYNPNTWALHGAA